MSVNHATPKVRTKSAGASSSKRIERFADDFLAQPAELAAQAVLEIEKNFTDNTLGMVRRMALASLGRTGKQIRDSVIDDRATALEVAKLAHEADAYAKRLRAFSEMMESASLRLKVGICFREDGTALIREAASAVRS